MTRISVCLIFLLTFVSCQDKTCNPYYLPEDVCLHEGDLVFRLGRSRESVAVNTVDKESSYSHVGIVVYESGDWKVIHAVPGESEHAAPDYVKKDPLPVFFQSDRAVCGAVMRCELDSSVIADAVDYAEMLYNRKVLFDGDFDMYDSTKVYCTELIYRAFMLNGIDIVQGRTHKIPFMKSPVILPSDIIKNDFVEEIFSFAD